MVWHEEVDDNDSYEAFPGEFPLGDHEIVNWSMQDLDNINLLQAGPSDYTDLSSLGNNGGQSNVQVRLKFRCTLYYFPLKGHIV